MPSTQTRTIRSIQFNLCYNTGTYYKCPCAFDKDMVLIYDNESDEIAQALRDDLIRRLIPCAVSRDEQLIAYSLVNILYMDDSGLEDVIFDDIETVILADRTALESSDRRFAEIKRIISRIEDVLLIKYGFDPYTIVRSAVYDSYETTKYFGRFCPLTNVEKLILRFIAVCGEKYAAPMTISRFCLKRDTSVGAVAVHINKINLRASFCSPIRLISNRRFSGYRLTRL